MKINTIPVISICIRFVFILAPRSPHRRPARAAPARPPPAGRGRGKKFGGGQLQTELPAALLRYRPRGDRRVAPGGSVAGK